MFLRQISKNLPFILTVFLAVLILSGCDKKSEEVQNQTANSSEIQGKLEEQQAKIDELQGYKDEQQRLVEEKNQQDEQGKKEDCQKRLKWTQEELASNQRQLGEDLKILAVAEADKCEDCYTKCMKSHNCSKSSCESSEIDFNKMKKECKNLHESNLNNRQSDVNDDKKSIAREEKKLSDVKAECEGYL